MHVSTPIREAARILRTLARERGLAAFEAAFNALPIKDAIAIANTWELAARDKQIRPADCKAIWAVVAGRGFGKTRTGSETTLNECEDHGPFDGALISKSIGDLRKDMIEGMSGLEVVGKRRGISVRYISNQAIVLVKVPGGGGECRFHVMSAEQPEFGRGPNLSYFWGDEIAAWPANAFSRFRDGFLPSWRIPFPNGDDMRAIVTSTPRPNAITQWLLREMTASVTITRGTSLENRHIRLSSAALAERGTKRWLQEYEGILLDSANLITPEILNENRVLYYPDVFTRLVVAIDPGIRKHESADATGIIVAAIDDRNPAHAYVIADLTAQGLGYLDWARLAIRAALDFGGMFRCPVSIVAETNQGGDGILDAIRGAAEEAGGAALAIPVVDVFARASKRARAETVVPLYETGRVHHVNLLPDLEREWTTWAEGAPSPNRLDACVYAISNLLLGEADVGPIWTPY